MRGTSSARASLPEVPLADLAGELEVVADVLLRFGAEAFDRLDLAGVSRRLEVVEGLDAEFAIEFAGGLRADALDAGDVGDVDRKVGAQLLEFLDGAGLDVLDDLRGDCVADAVDLLERLAVAVGDVVGYRRGMGADVLRRTAVRSGLYSTSSASRSANSSKRPAISAFVAISDPPGAGVVLAAQRLLEKAFRVGRLLGLLFAL